MSTVIISDIFPIDHHLARSPSRESLDFDETFFQRRRTKRSSSCTEPQKIVNFLNYNELENRMSSFKIRNDKKNNNTKDLRPKTKAIDVLQTSERSVPRARSQRSMSYTGPESVAHLLQVKDDTIKEKLSFFSKNKQSKKKASFPDLRVLGNHLIFPDPRARTKRSMSYTGPGSMDNLLNIPHILQEENFNRKKKGRRWLRSPKSSRDPSPEKPDDNNFLHTIDTERTRRSFSYTDQSSFSKLLNIPGKPRSGSLLTTKKDKSPKASPNRSPINKRRLGFLFGNKNKDHPVTNNETSSNTINNNDEERLAENEENFLSDAYSSFGTNSWYHGETVIVCIKECINNPNSILSTTEDDYINGSIIARVDDYSNVSCFVLFTFEDETYVQTIPCENEMYCLDFSDDAQPRFPTMKLLVGYLVENKFLQRVTFSRLLQKGLLL